MAENFVVTPWEVSGKIDYNRLVKQFGTTLITQQLKNRIKKDAGESNVMLERGIYYSHRDLELVLNDYEAGRGFFLYTGRGPSSAMHIGHLLPFLFTKWLQDRFDANLYIEVTDDEKFLLNAGKSLDEVRKQSREDILDIMAIGFDPNKTFVFQDTEYIKNVYPLALRIAKKINFSNVRAVFGFGETTNIGISFYPTMQIVPTMFEKKRCLIPAAIDQDPYWRIQRDIAGSMGYFKASEIHSKLLPPLSNTGGKMSSSQPETAIYLTDDRKTVGEKIMKHAFSGGQDTVELHRKKGGNPDVDISFQWLRFLFEPDDKKLKKMEEEYRSGKLLTGELKEILVEKLNVFLERHREQRAKMKEFFNLFTHSGKLAEKMWNTIYE